MSNDIIIKLLPVIGVLLLLQITLIIIGLKDIIPRDASEIRGSKVIWIILIIFLSGGVGSIIYLSFGKRKLQG